MFKSDYLLFIVSFFDLCKSAVSIIICLCFKAKSKLLINQSSVILFHLVMAVYCERHYHFGEREFEAGLQLGLQLPSAIVTDLK